MYIPEAFKEEDREAIVGFIRSCRLATFVTSAPSGLIATPLPLIYEAEEGPKGTLYGHLAKANPQWQDSILQIEALVLFQGADAYITPAWYPSKAETGRVVPTWNYVAVHAYGNAEFFTEPDRLREAVSLLTRLHEDGRPEPWSVNDAPAEYIEGQLRAIVGVRIPVNRIEAKRKMSQNQPPTNRAGVVAGLSESLRQSDRLLLELIKP